jgi:hypothetical protein
MRLLHKQIPLTQDELGIWLCTLIYGSNKNRIGVLNKDTFGGYEKT